MLCKHLVTHREYRGCDIRLPNDTSPLRADRTAFLLSRSFFVFRFRFHVRVWSFFSQIVSDNAVFARDFLAGAYVASKDRAGEVAGATVHKSLQVRA